MPWATGNPGMWLALGVSLAFALSMLVVEWRRAPLWDEREYLDAARGIQLDGLLSRWFSSGRRTYLYPFFLSLARRIGGYPRGTVAVAQWLAWVGSCVWISRTLNRARPWAPRGLWFTTLCNPFVLIYTVEYLTDAFSTALVFVSLACAAAVASADRRKYWDALLGLAVGSAIMTRPSNVVLVPMAVAACWPGRVWTQRASAIARAALAAAIVVAPQMIVNWSQYHVVQPLVVARLGAQQISWGRVALKYASAVAPNRPSQVWYRNPYVRTTLVMGRHHLKIEADAAATPASFSLLGNAWATVRTLPLKTVALLDQDLVFPYNQTLRPTYRWPVAAIHFPILGLGVLGFIAFLRENDYCRRFAALAGIFVVSFVALYNLTVVEARFGLPLVAVFYLFAPAGAVFAAESMRAGPAFRRVWIPAVWLIAVSALFAGARALTSLMA